MPPKKKGGGKGKSTKKKSGGDEERIADEFDTMTLDELKMHVVQQTDVLKALKNQRNAYQIERDQIQQFYDLTHNEYMNVDAQLRNIETEMQKMQTTHLNDIRWYMSKVTHLELDHKTSVQKIAKQTEDRRNEELERTREKRSELRNERDELKVKLCQYEASNEEEISQLVELHRKEILKLREEFERQSNQLEARYNKKLVSLQDDLELQRKMEIHEVEERKNLHINDLMENHEKAFTEMRNYYNSITRDNLALIKSLKEELVELKVKTAQNEKTKAEISAENKKLNEPLMQARGDVNELQTQLKSYDKDKRSLKLAKSRLVVLESKLSSMNVEHELLEERFRQVSSDRDKLYATFADTIVNVQQRNEAKNLLLERKVENFTEKLQRKVMQFNEVLRAANLDQAVIHNLTSKLDTVIDSKNSHIKSLRFSIAKATKAHDDLVRVYEAKLPNLGVPIDDLGLQVLSNETLCAPASLVAK